jgi:hypothetical protein
VCGTFVFASLASACIMASLERPSSAAAVDVHLLIFAPSRCRLAARHSCDSVNPTIVINDGWRNVCFGLAPPRAGIHLDLSGAATISGFPRKGETARPFLRNAAGPCARAAS